MTTSVETTTGQTTWDTCKVAFVADENDASFGQFIAPAICPHGDYMASESIKFRIDMDFQNHGDVALPPTGRNRNKLSIFLTSMQNGGWELLPDTDANATWYEKHLRRPTRPPANKKVTRKQWVWIVGILICIALPTAYAIRTWMNPFPVGVTKYMEMQPFVDETIEYPDPHYRGKILVVNPLPVRVTDPLSGRPDPIHWKLPDDMRADEYEEIGTVVWVSCRTFFRSKMVSRDCEVTTFDANNLDVYDFRDFPSDQYRGPIPARERIGLRDEEAILNYIVNLPKRE